MPRTERQLLTRLRVVASRLSTLDHKRDELWAERAALFDEGQALNPPVTLKCLGRAASLSDAGVLKAIRKAHSDAV